MLTRSGLFKKHKRDQHKKAKGNSACHAITYYNNTNDSNPANGVVDNKDACDAVAVYNYYYIIDTTIVEFGEGIATNVKSKAANSLGMYDMSGNVKEWCFERNGSSASRFSFGEASYISTFFLRIGYNESSTTATTGLGFRLTRTQP